MKNAVSTMEKNAEMAFFSHHLMKNAVLAFF
jgi:hypothetical protein